MPLGRGLATVSALTRGSRISMRSSLQHINVILRLRSHCTIFCKRLKARAEIRHTDPLECSDCKIFACGKKLAHAKKLVG